ncbi:MAG: protein translocase subunit SecD [Gemmatimonadales bacterium]|nr:MAG: protein translocase subunit SecD [Gemmatimonadales bacterium]
MFKSIRARIFVILAVVLASGWYLYQNYEATGSPIKLGLDLQGGMHLVLEIDDPENLIPMDVKSDLISQSERVLRNRVDELGVEEPLIQKVGQDRLIVELAGVTDEERAKEIVGTTALLEFRLVRPLSQVEPYLARIDRAIVVALGVDSLRALGRAQTAPDGGVEDLIFGGGAPADTPPGAAPDPAADPSPDPILQQDPPVVAEEAEDPEAELSDDERTLRPFTSLLLSGGDGAFLVSTEDYPVARMFLQMPEVRGVLPRGRLNSLSLHFGWQPTALGGRTYRELFLLEGEAFLAGDELETAQAIRDQQTNQPVVTFGLSRAGGRNFGRTTGANIGERIAIVLDNDVVSAPVVRGEIRQRGQIELGGAAMDEARDLAMVLRAGALPAPLRIMEERTVGPSLGQDSIDQGQIAGIIGLLLVVLIMIAYYRMSGVLAVVALTVYVILVMGGLAAIGATLTVPGIAGLILSIGMAVDANVLIFERIREEVDAGRAVRTAVDEGFGNALSAIVDANLTTLITALILFQFGTGPVRGFAVTLTIGIIASFFTALFVTRTLYLFYIRNKRAQDTISI